MAENEDVTVDFDAVDAAVAAGKAPINGKTPDAEPTVIVDPEVTAAADDKTVITPEAGVEKLKKQLEEERALRIAADNRAREASNAEAAARGETQKSHLEQIQGAIEKATQMKGMLKAKYAEAAAAGDWAAASEVQSDMADNAADIRQLKAGEHALKNAPAPKVRAPIDPVEEYIGRIGAEYPRSREWVRAHPEFVRDPHKERQMVAAHELAIARGLAVDSDEYFKDIGQTLRVGESPTKLPPHVDDSPMTDEPTADTAARATGGRSAAPAAAPVTRSGNGAGGSRPGSVKLSPAEVEAAYNSFPDSKTPLEDYARNKLALRKEGKLS